MLEKTKEICERFIISLLLKKHDNELIKNRNKLFFEDYKIKSDDFNNYEYKKIFSSFEEVKEKIKDYTYFDIISNIKDLTTSTLAWTLHTENDYVTIDEVESVFNLFIKQVKENKLISILEKHKNDINTKTQSEIINSIENSLKEIEQINNEIITGNDLAKKMIINENNKKRVGKRTETGFYKLDILLGGGFKKTSLNVIAARPSVGKTSLAVNIATNLLKQYKSVLFVSLEMSFDEIGDKIIKSLSTKDLCSEYESFISGVEKLSKYNLFLLDKGRVTISDIETSIKGILKNNDIDLCIVDYLGLLTPNEKRQNKVLEISDITRDLKLISKEYEIPILLLCQMNRNIENEKRKPILADLRDSGSIEQDADTVLFLSRDRKDDSGVTQVILEKNRHGKCGELDYVFNGNNQVFSEIENIIKKDFTN